MKYAVCALMFLLAARADEVLVRNGDRVTGKFVKLENGKVSVETEFFGAVQVAWDAVSSLNAGGEVYLVTKTGQILAGPVRVQDQDIVIETANAGPVILPRDEITRMRSEGEEVTAWRAARRAANPTFFDIWKGSLATGVVIARGNANTSTYSLSLNAARTTRVDKLVLNATTLYARGRDGSATTVTANARRGSARYDRQLSRNSFAFGSGDLEFDQFQRLDLRSVLGTGFGRNVIRSEGMTLDFLGGASYNREAFSNGLTRSIAEGLFSEEFTKNFPALQIRQKFIIYPAFSNPGEFRMALDASATTNLWKWVGLQVALSNRFISNPIPGTQRSDVILTTGFKITAGN